MEIKKEENENLAEEKEVINDDLMRFIRIVLIALVLLIATVLTTGWGLYKLNWQNSFSETVSRFIPYPIATVNYTNWITFDEYNKNVKSIKKFLENKETAFKNSGFDFSTEDGLKRLAVIKKNVLNQLIENRMVKLLAEERGIKISSGEIADTTTKILTRDGQEKENLAQLSLLYGWDANDFRDQVISNLLYREKLETLIKGQGELDKESKVKLDVIKGKIQSKEDFGEIAKQLSESPSREYGGLLPVFSQEEAPADLKNLAFSLPIGKISDPIESEDGWYIIKVERKFSENGTEKVEIRNVFVKRDSFESWLTNQKNKFKVYLPESNYFWHTEMGKVYFKDEALNKLENEINRASLNENLQATDFLLNVSGGLKQK